MEVDVTQPTFWLSVLQVIWINILLSGDNAVVIALACRGLPPRERMWGMIIGAGFAGLSAALELVNHGANVVVLEREFPGVGARGRNAGYLAGALGLAHRRQTVAPGRIGGEPCA